MKSNTEYTGCISYKDIYITNETKISAFPSLSFFTGLIKIIVHANRLVKKGVYSEVRWYNSSDDIRQLLEKVGIKLHISGMDNMRKFEGPAVFVGNHMSTLETMILPCLIQPNKRVVFVIKEELAKYPVFGPVANAREPILVGRENPREDLKTVLEEGTKRLQDGKSVIIFPQKTRNAKLEPEYFNTLGNKLAKRNNVPVVPVALVTDAWGNGKVIKEAGKIDPSKTVYFAFGEPIYITGNGNDEHKKIISFISQKIKEWGRSDLLG